LIFLFIDKLKGIGRAKKIEFGRPKHRLNGNVELDIRVRNVLAV
jgi:hypothetical protein